MAAPPRHADSLLSAAAAVVFSGVFGFSTVSKLLGAHEFSVVMDALLAASLQPSPEVARIARVVLAALVVGWEALLVVLLLVPSMRRVSVVLAAVTLIVFSGVLVFMMSAGIPRCGCMGTSPLAGPEDRAGMWLGLIRNAGLLLIAAVAWPRGHHEQPGHEASGGPATAGGRSNGFTIVELLVVIAIIGLLVAISLPALGSARATALKGKELATHRQLVAALHLYAEANDGYPPYINVPGQPFTPSPMLEPSRGSFSYFRAHAIHWALPLIIAEYIPAELVVIPGLDVPTDPHEPVASTYFFSQAFAADPRFWVGERTPTDMSLLRGIKLDAVRFTAQKGIIANPSWTDQGSMEYDGKWTVAFSDGSARRKEHFTVPLSRAYGSIPWVVLTTENGVYGLDYP